MEMRLQIYLARSGMASSRRKAEELIKDKKVKINGKIAKLGDKVDADKDKIEVSGETARAVTEKFYIMLNKPVDYLVAKSDARGRKLAFDLMKEPSIDKEKLSEREFKSLFNVGRLDLNTEGLILFTNDGDFALKLTHPRYRVRKVYVARLKGRITDEAVDRLQNRVLIRVEDLGKVIEYRSAPAKVRVLGRGKEGFSIIILKIAEGKKREVRRMCEAVGYPVIALKRVQIAELELGKLQVGKWRFLTKDEVSKLVSLIRR